MLSLTTAYNQHTITHLVKWKRFTHIIELRLPLHSNAHTYTKARGRDILASRMTMLLSLFYRTPKTKRVGSESDLVSALYVSNIGTLSAPFRLIHMSRCCCCSSLLSKLIKLIQCSNGPLSKGDCSSFCRLGC